jgi:enterochelin esterase-like enzyme
LITETFDYDGGRQVTAYVPARQPEAVVFAGDGQTLARWGADAPVPTLLVGVHRATDDTQRLHEYSPGFEPERFAAHANFFVEDVREWVVTRFNLTLTPQRCAILGVSASGELALALGLRHPDVYGAILCASPGAGYRPPNPLPHPIPRTYLLAGADEPFFLANAKRWADALHDADAQFVMKEQPGGHGGPFWREEFPAMINWAFS